MAISGFPEWLPQQRIIEQALIERAQRVFELYGFASLETRAVEPLETLLAKGETSKEVYLLRRLQGEETDESTLGLHFDLTVPFARFVVENAGRLVFPFRRYQIQKCWRGERPAQGRYREFLQADIDIVDRDTLAPHFDAEFPLIIADVLGGLPLPPIRVQVNNRKVLKGFYQGLGILEPEAAIRTVDKLDKIGPDGVAAELAGFGVTESQAKLALALADISASDTSFVDDVRKLGVTDPLLDEGLEELAFVIETAAEHAPGLCFAELKIARGLDYYTGTVYETKLVGFENAGSICGGGRYDNLASSGTDRYPGVGISLGISRTLGVMFGRDALTASRSVPTCVLVALPAEEDRREANRIAGTLRSRGIATEVSPSAAKFGKQIKFAERRGIPFVWFPQTSEVKDIRSGDQVQADSAEWAPPPEDLHPTISGSFD